MSYGVGQGLNEGVKTAGNFLLAGMQLNQRQAYVDAYAKRATLAGFGSADAWHPANLNRFRMGASPMQSGAAALKPTVP